MAYGTNDIWAELARRRISAGAIARALGVAPSTVTRAINGDTRTHQARILDHIAGLLGVGVKALAPGRPSSCNPEPTSNPTPESMSDHTEIPPARAAAGGC